MKGKHNIIYGKYIKVWQHNRYFNHISEMLLHYYDTSEYDNTLFILGSYINYKKDFFQKIFPNSKIIVYQLEQLMRTKKPWNSVPQIINNLKSYDIIWDMDHLNKEYLEKYKNIEVQKVQPFLYTPSLKNENIDNENCDIDVLFYGFVNERRSEILLDIQKKLYNTNINLVTLFGNNDKMLDDFINRSKIILNIHAHEPWHRQEQPRIFYPLINNKLIVSEISQYTYFRNAIIEGHKASLAGYIINLVKNNKWKNMAERNAKIFKEGKNEEFRHW